MAQGSVKPTKRAEGALRKKVEVYPLSAHAADDDDVALGALNARILSSEAKESAMFLKSVRSKKREPTAEALTMDAQELTDILYNDEVDKIYNYLTTE